MDKEEETDVALNVSFREKDVVILREECRGKYALLGEIIAEVVTLVCRKCGWRTG